MNLKNNEATESSHSESRRPGDGPLADAGATFPCLFETGEDGEATGTVMPFCSPDCLHAAGGTTYPGVRKAKAGNSSVGDFGFTPHCEQCGKDVTGGSGDAPDATQPALFLETSAVGGPRDDRQPPSGANA